ncbi:MAG: hypothetical protein EAZ92_00330 [Candidatus Kapaibacterium sp.]|nr:MAG: hypothetical protein EAZ92_00330 [Candidatus Kapabacteria bacterium]
MTLKEFLTAISTDAEQLAAFQADPDKAMQAVGLTPQEQELMKSGDEQRVREYLQEKGEVPVSLMVSFLVSPPGDSLKKNS